MKNRTSLLVAVLLIVIIVVVVIVILSGGASKGKILIGCISPFSGNGAIYGQDLKRGFEIAMDETRAEDPSFADRIEIIYEDDQLDAQKGVSAIQKLIDVDKVSLVIGPFTSNVALAITPIAESKKTVLLIPTATNYRLRNAGDYVFRVCPSDDLQGKTLADYVADTMNEKKIAILYMNTDYGVGLKDSFGSEFQKRGGEIAISEPFEKDTTDVRAQLNKVKESGVSLVFMPSNYKEAAVAVRQAKEMGLSLRFVGTDGTFEPDFLTLTQGASEGMLLTTMTWDPSSPDASSFAEKYKKKYGEEPGAYSALCYDSLKIALECLKKGNTDSDSIKKAFYAISFKGATGLTAFDKDGEVDKTFTIYQVKDGKFVRVK